MVTKTSASKVRPRTLASRRAWYPLIAPERSRARSRRWQGERLRRTRSASSVRVSRPSRWSSASIFLSTSSMEKILPLVLMVAQRVRSTFGAERPSLPFVTIGAVIAFWAVSFLLVLVPGADWAYAIAAGLRDRSVLPAVAGLLAGYAGLTAVVAAGLAALIARWPLALTALTALGALYLLCLGVTTVMARPSAPSAAADDSRQPWVRR